MRTRLFLIVTVLLAALALPVAAQTTNKTTQTIWDFLSTGSNYVLELAGSFAPDISSSKVNPGQFGGEIGLGVKVSEWAMPMLTLSMFHSQLYLVDATVQFQPPRKVLGKFPVIPYARGGVATSFGGLGTANGDPIGIVGAGAYFDLSVLGASWFSKNVQPDIRWDHWVGFPAGQSDNLVFGFRMPLPF